jgi:hypothetical protein
MDMTTKERLITEIERTPETLLAEILDFVQFLKVKSRQPEFDPARASEPALGKDWLRPEEDEAWQTL